MHIISGKYKGHKLSIPKTHIHPTMDRVREAIFSMIRDRLNDAVVLDIFAGSGSLGLEALSQGAKICHFVDKSFKSINCIEKNLIKLNINNNVKVIKNSTLNFLTKCNENYYDIIFVDPPYRSKVINDIVKEIFTLNILKQEGLIVAECRVDENLSNIKNSYIKTKIYGDTKIFIIKKRINNE
ncbi:MAG: 16S rRNA (guanine(966)-N(2))-methyltransferase RsmD [Candidatus Cloacimonetes bacterium]|nr:16S rRNA (guanine(966)-N(2))-methyltransferase RsmD [Candidatus Cloacimonadota bacterium]MBL7086219.1 16S rRNA (guanine(966)-N(2))-methyltransferase RsmD [Candidatus Cloacimonadota bacterium]